MQIDELLTLAFKVGASDVHLTVGAAPAFRLHGSLLPLDAPEWQRLVPAGTLPEVRSLAPADTEAMARAIMTEEQYGKFCELGEVDFGYEIPGVGRFRVNAFRQRGSAALVLRLINTRIPSFEELGLPEVLPQLARRPNGLILVTGPTGSGKSTTLAAMIDLINSERRCHIITLEDPIEYVHRHRKSLVNQREIGHDSRSFASALRVALREDPDVILVGEMRDLETISTALTAAETGHLVFATLHTQDAPQTIDRIIDVFPTYQQQQVRLQLASTIQAIVTQQLLPTKDGQSRVPAVEVMVATSAIRNLIREAKVHQIYSAMQAGGQYKMQTMDQSIAALYKRGVISYEVAMSRCNNRDEMERLIG